MIYILLFLIALLLVDRAILRRKYRLTDDVRLFRHPSRISAPGVARRSPYK